MANANEQANAGLDLVLERPVWTSALGPGFRPSSHPFVTFTCILTFEDVAGGTRYTARALHQDKASAEKHAQMGFTVGWGKALDQLVGIAGQIRI